MNEESLKTVLRALVMSSPHTDALYRWKDPEWHAQRQEAIEIVGREIDLVAEAIEAKPPSKVCTPRQPEP